MNSEFEMFDVVKYEQASDRFYARSIKNLFELYKKEIARILEENGFSKIKLIDGEGKILLGMFMRAAGDGQPYIKAFKDGKNACIFFPKPAKSWLQVEPLDMAQYDYIEKHLKDTDVYYASFLYGRVEEEGMVLSIIGFVKVREHGKWKTDSPQSETLLPFSKTPHSDRISPLIGGAVSFKCPLLLTTIIDRGEVVNMEVKGVPKNEALAKYVAKMILPTPTLALLLEIGDEKKAWNLRRSFFYSDQDPTSKLALVDFCDDADDLGIITLMDRNGNEYAVECLESLTVRQELKSGACYTWTLSMLADHILKNESKIEIKSGVLFEMAKEDYRAEHGCEAPEDYSVTVSMEKMKMWNPYADTDPYATVTGLVESVEHLVIFGSVKLTVLRMQCVPDNEEVHMNIYVSDFVLDGYTPEVGDNITCSGFVHAAPDTVVEMETSWLDSPEVALEREDREAFIRASHVYREYAPYSIAMACVASALEENGWRIVGDNRNRPVSYPSLIAARQDDSYALFFIDTFIDDKKAVFTFDPNMERIGKSLKDINGVDHAVLGDYYIKVKLEYLENLNRYKIELLDDGGFPEELNLPMIGSTNSGKGEKVEVSGEEAMVKIFHSAMTNGDWVQLTEAMSETMHYHSFTADVDLYGKMDYIRYMADKVNYWKKSDLWRDFIFKTGTIMYEGRERPCCMTYYCGKKNAGVIFEVQNGLAIKMTVLPKHLYDAYVDSEEAECSKSCTMLVREGNPKIPKLQARLHQMALDWLSERMEENGGMSHEGSAGFMWLKKKMTLPSFCDLVFEFRGNVFAVLPIEATDANFSVPKEKEALLLKYAEENDMIPCVFPVDVRDKRLLSFGWNLINLNSRSFINPTKLEPRENVPLSRWEQRLSAIMMLCSHIEEQGGIVLSWQDSLGVYPQIWFEDQEGRKCWVLLSYDDGSGADTEVSILSPQKERLKNYPGYIACVGYRSADMGVPLRHRGAMCNFHGLKAVTDDMW